MNLDNALQFAYIAAEAALVGLLIYRRAGGFCRFFYLLHLGHP